MSRIELPGRGDRDADALPELSAWLTREAPHRARPELLASTLARTRTMPGPARRRAPFGPALPPLGLPLRFAIVGLLIVALSGAAIVGGRLVLPRTSSPTVLPSAAPPSVVPSPAGYASPLPVTGVTRLDSAGGATIGDVTLGGRGLLAVGWTYVAGGRKDGAVWTSSDGSTWTRTASGGALSNGSILRIAGRGTAFVAFGVDCPTNVQQQCGWGRAWTSTDGTRWTSAATVFGGPSAGGTGYGFSAIVQGGPGYVMVGGTSTADTYGGTYLGPVVADSRDGSHWTVQRLTGRGFDGASFAGIASGSTGFVAVGSTAVLTPAIWTSADGTAWQAVSTASTFGGGSRLEDVTAGPSGYVAVGRGDGPLAGAWVSADGVTWSPARYTLSFQDAEITRVVWTGTAFVAMGRTAAGDSAAWVSTEGFDWTPVDTGAAFRSVPVVAAAAIAGHIVLFGQDKEGTIIVGTLALR